MMRIQLNKLTQRAREGTGGGEREVREEGGEREGREEGGGGRRRREGGKGTGEGWRKDLWDCDE